MSKRNYSAAVSSNLMANPVNNATTGGTHTQSSSASTTIDAYHPYFLQSSDNPGIALVTQSLTVQNYQQWSRSVKLALSAKNKVGLIDGSQPKPAENSPLYAFWHRCNDMVLSWLLNSISTEIRDSVVYFSTAQEIWEDLAIRFSQGNVPRIFQLKKELTSLNQGNMSITAYFTRMRSLTDELNALSPIPKCICPQNSCVCGVTAKLEAYEQINSLSQFLMGLSDLYTSIRGQMLMMKPLPTLSQAYSLLLQEESQRASPGVVESVAMNVQYSGSKTKPYPVNSFKKGFSGDKSGDASTENCDYCHNPGHTQDKCFFLHGYPDWHRLYGKPKPKLRTKKAAQVTVKTTDTEIKGSGNSKDVFSEAQCEQIAKMIQNSMKSISGTTGSVSHLSGKIHSVSLSHTAYSVQTSSNITWIIDSGATDHIVSNVNLFNNYKSISSVLHLPNNTTVPITHVGEVQLNSKVLLTDVLCVPSFHCNLISISKLTSDNSVSVIFSKTNCMLQDPSQKMMVEIGKAEAGLYNFTMSSNSESFVNHLCSRIYVQPSIEAQLWHDRLGHPAASILNKVSVTSSVNNDQFTTCDVCIQAKQHRLPFPIVDNSSYDLFELVHCDL